MMKRFGLGGLTNLAPTAVPAIQFEDFQPKSEWKEEELSPPSQTQPRKASLLHIHLPEFKKEQLKVTFVQSTRTLRVSGERPLSDAKRSRFNVAFPVPHNCDATQIQGKYQDGVLVVTIPQFPTLPPAVAAAGPHPPPPPATVPAAAVKNQEASQPKSAPSIPPLVNDPPNKNAQSVSQDDKNSEKNKNDDAKTVPPAKESTAVAAESKPTPQEKQKEGKVPDVKIAPPLQEKEKEGKVPDNNPISEADRQQAAGKKRKQDSSMATAAAATEELISGRVHDQFDGEGVMSSIKKRREGLAAVAKDAAESTSAKISDVGERVKESAAAAGRKTADEGLQIKERLDQLVREDNRQAMVGMSLAVIAVVAVGAFVIYRYRSSSS
ncbi:Inactive protein RESTRICTED TEV MOVEMENT 2 [Linum perenne]